MNKKKINNTGEVNYMTGLKNIIPKFLLISIIDASVVIFGTLLMNDQITAYSDGMILGIYITIIYAALFLPGGIISYSVFYLILSYIRPSVIKRGLLEKYLFITLFTAFIFNHLYHRLTMDYSYYSLYPFADTYFKMSLLMWSITAAIFFVTFIAACFLTGFFLYISRYLLKSRLQMTISVALIVCFISVLVPVAYNSSRIVEKEELTQLVKPEDYADNNKVYLIGVDGAAWNIIDPLLKKGELSNIKYIIDNGVRGNNGTSVPTHSPILWTSIATGQKDDKHGIKSFILIKFAGVSEPLYDILQRGIFDKLDYLQFTGLVDAYPINNFYRRTPALWNILSRYGKKSIVVNWFPSFPAERINGAEVSDKLLRVIDAVKGTGIDPCEKFSYLVYPDTLCSEINTNLKSFLSHDVKKRKWISAFEKNIYISENIYFNISKKLLKTSGKVDFFAYYMRGTDDLEHLYWKYIDENKFPSVTDEERAKYGNVIYDYYRQVDKYIGEILSEADEDTVMIVISDHGHEPFFTGFDSTQSGAHGLGPDGIFIAYGKNITGKFKSQKPTIYDITPTILYLLGLPVAQDMDGKILTDIIDQDFIAGNPPKTVPTYYLSQEVYWVEKKDKETQMKDESLMDKLKALGYMN